MPDIITTTFNKYYKPTNDYWTPVTYTGIKISTLSILKITKTLKDELVNTVVDNLHKEHPHIERVLFKYIVLTTFFEDGILVTPLEAIYYCKSAIDLFSINSALSTYAYPQAIKERIRQFIRANSNSAAPLTLFNYLGKGVIYKYFRDIKRLNVPESYNNSVVMAMIYDLGLPLFIEYLSNQCNRQVILDNLKYDFYLYLKGCIPLATELDSEQYLLKKYTISEIDALLNLLHLEVTTNYYEPLIFTRYDKQSSSLCPNSLKFIENADIYSKFVRIESIRRRSLIQDSRYIITEAFKDACRRYKEELT
jgi:hypothetical protein